MYEKSRKLLQSMAVGKMTCEVLYIRQGLIIVVLKDKYSSLLSL